MSLSRIAAPILDAEERFEGFENLMPFRVQNILLVSSLYDSFILREDGRLNELLIDESLELNLRQIPGITHVSSCAEALDLASSNPQFNLIVTNLAVGDMDAAQLAREVRRKGLDVPVVVLGYDYREIKSFVARNPVTDIDRVFLWQGTARILIAIVKYVEDKRNVLHDTRAMGVPVLLVVEDNIRYYSSFLPVIYTELIKQSRRVIQEGINVAHKLVRMQARPKILLSSNFEDAAQLVQEYRDYIFGLVSDVEFPWDGKLSPEAGFELARMVKSLTPDVPVVLQTSRTEFRPRAQAEGYSFLRKRSPTLLKDLRRILTDHFGFGDFVFRMPDQQRSGTRQRLDRTGRNSADAACRQPDVPRAAQSFLALADGAHRVRPGRKAEAAQGIGLQRPRASTPRSDRIDQRISPRTERSADRRFQARHLQALRLQFSKNRFRLARRQSPRPRLRPSSAAHSPHHASLSRRADFRSSRRGHRHRSVRPVPRRKQFGRLRVAL